MTGETNYGIQISGGTVNSGAMAAGPGARAVHNVTASPVRYEQIQVLLEEIRRLMAAHADSVEDLESAREEVRRVGAELEKPKPDRTTLSSVLERLAGRVASVSTLAEAVANLTKLIFS
ncbi:MAG: hypothetical protein IRZ07_25985 [Microbispora sp.]|nr:hypothetical protein [Microbispora sp.]